MFSRTRSIKLDELISGITNSLIKSQQDTQKQVIEHIARFTKNHNNVKMPLTLSFKKLNKEIEIPLLSLLPLSNIAIEQAEVEFAVNIDSVSKSKIKNKNQYFTADEEVEIMVSYEKKDTDEIPMKIKIKFIQNNPPLSLTTYIDNIT